ncbi:MAG TPA: transcription termination factor NusA [Candidatus Intestinimonas pullistercoris]|uniref:Transcription termination/antitermination protein NusA n=1 Tax=Candidatus Intestinimonas pullistercoris TaxID=2838623 RepID=A0A9D2SZC8_9FIRM|nr:transcription termination factor NusA [uncultured Intestinimonas sp.]HJC41383.1 transcription termination factor NusA [Candidatus Intestinimonas pullistercoris]
MPRKNAKKANSGENAGQEFFAAIAQIEKEKGIPAGYMMEKITQALASAYKRDHEGAGDNIEVKANPETGEVRMFILKDIVESVDNPATEISLEEARSAIPHAELGDVVRIEVKPRNFGRIAAQTARQVIIQGIREAERGMVYDEFSSKEHEILTGVVTRIDPRNGAASLRISSSSEYTDAFLAPGEQVRGETIHEGDRLKVYVVEVRRSTRGPQVLLSRTHPGLVKRLFELEIPEIYDGTVEVKSIAREAGSRTKIAVWSAEPNVDPIGACVGPGGARVNSIVEELHGEKVDIIKYSEDPAQYVAASLSPADVLSVDLLPDGKSCRVVVPDDQLSLAIGKEGQNARLAAKLTGFKIDIKPASDPGELPDPEEDLLVVDDGDEPAEELLEEPVGEAPEESSNDIQV